MTVISYQEPRPPRVSQDRRGILLTFGIILIGIGSIVAFIGVGGALLALAGPAMVSTPRGARTATPAVRPGGLAASAQSLLWFGGIATAMIWTGVGSVLMKRWSRPIVLAGSGTLIGIGLVTLAVMAVLYAASPISPPPTLYTPLRGGPPVQTLGGDSLILFAVCIIIVFVVIVPGVFFLAYRGEGVRHTLDAADPVLGWTDRCPLPVLTLALIFAYLAYVFFLALFAATTAYVSTTRVPGVPLPDVGAAVLVTQVVTCVLCAWVAWLLYRRSSAGPWMAIVMIALFAAGGLGALATPTALNDPVLTALGGTVPASDLQWEMQVISVRSMIVVGGFALAATIFTLYCRRELIEMKNIGADRIDSSPGTPGEVR